MAENEVQGTDFIC